MQKTQHTTYTFSELNVDVIAEDIRSNWGLPYITLKNGQDIHLVYNTDEDDTEYAFVEWMYQANEGIHVEIEGNTYGVLQGFRVYYK